jgi:hypothetical protein
MSDAPYRDDRDADQARIASLESELAHAKERVAELEQRRSQALVLTSSSALTRNGKPSLGTRIAGAPLLLELERTFQAAFPADKLEDLIGIIRGITKERGHTELLRASMAWSSITSARGTGPLMNVTVTIRDGTTQLIVSDRLGQLAGALYGGVGGGVGGGAIMLPILASIGAPYLAPLIFAGWFGGVYAGARALFKRGARKRAERVQAVFDALADEIQRTLSSLPRPT